MSVIKKHIILSFLLFVLIGCSNEDNSIKHKDTIEYEQDVIDACTLITEVNGIKLKETDYELNKIQKEGTTILCEDVNVRKLGKKTSIVKINGENKKIEFMVEDTTSPVIEVDKEFNVEVGNTYFDLAKEIEVIDAYDLNVFLGYTGAVDIHKVGTYEVEINAKDINSNKSIETVTINVLEKEVQIIEKEVIVTEPSTPIISNSPTQMSPAPAPNITNFLPLKQFLFSEGYNIRSGFDACTTYMSGSSGGCSPLTNEDGIVYGYQYHH